VGYIHKDVGRGNPVFHWLRFDLARFARSMSSTKVKLLDPDKDIADKDIGRRIMWLLLLMRPEFAMVGHLGSSNAA